MAEQTRLQSEIVSEVPSAARWSTASTTEAGARDPLIEDYLDHLCAPLVGVLPYARRQELRAEWGAHLDAMVEAYQEVGDGPAGAVVHALKQFGDPEQVARQWLRECMPAQRGPEPVLPAVLGSLAFFLVASGAALVLTERLNAAPKLPLLIVGLLAAGLPILAGFFSGCLVRGRNALGTFYALALLTALFTGGAWLVGANGGAPPLEIPFVQFAFWLPLGSAAAAVGGAARRRAVRVSRRWSLR